MKAVKITGQCKAAVVNDAAQPKLSSPDWVLVKVVAVALNPTDWKHIGYGAPATVGCDFSGVVVEVGSNVTQPFKKGHRVCGAVHGSNKLAPTNGAFQEYLNAIPGLLMHIPEYMSFEEGAAVTIGALTVGQGLYQTMQLPWPDKPSKEKKPILIWGGSSATGAIGIQLAKLSGYEVITTCSPKNFDYVKSLGADAVFDSRSPTVGNDIRAYTKNKLYDVWDTIGEHGSPKACAAALASSYPEGQKIRYGTIVGTPDQNPPREDAEIKWSLGYTAMGAAIDVMGFKAPAQPGHYEFATKWMAFVEKLLKDRKLKPHRIEVRKGGFEGVLTGLRDLKEGRVSCAKLVYRVGYP